VPTRKSTNGQYVSKLFQTGGEDAKQSLMCAVPKQFVREEAGVPEPVSLSGRDVVWSVEDGKMCMELVPMEQAPSNPRLNNL